MSKNLVFHIFIFFVVFLSVGLALQVRYWKNEVETLAGLEPTVITVTDTITVLKPDSIFFKEFIKDTFYYSSFIRDTVNDTEFVVVDVPIYSYIFDTTINSDTISNVDFHISVSGYRVRLDTLSYKIHHSLLLSGEPSKPRLKLCPAIGVGYGTGGWGIFGGVGLTFN